MDIQNIINEHRSLLDKFDTNAVERIANVITDAFAGGFKLLIAGNGGSAADAQHMAAELVGRFRMDRKALPAIALTTDSSILTAVGNDYNFNHIFVRQVEALGREGDIYLVLSTSGESKNIIESVKRAKEKGLFVISLTGEKDTSIERESNFNFCADTISAARAQEIHQLAYHIICELVENNIVSTNELRGSSCPSW